MVQVDEINNIGVIGAGLMGHSIAQLFASKGYRVSIFDNDQQMLHSVPERIRKNLSVYCELGLLEPSAIDVYLKEISLCPTLDAVCREAHFVIEAVSENLELKRQIFLELEERVNANTILASNTSAISITKISELLRTRERVLGTHFWNPAHIIPCVEVIRSDFTDEGVYETVIALLTKVGKEPVRVLKDVPGFLGNRMQHALWREAVSLVEHGIASAEDIDRVVKYSFGLRMPFIGPLETADLAGLDLTFAVHEDLFPYLEVASQPSPVLQEKIARGELGVKTGRGFHVWTAKKVAETIGQRDRFLLKLLQHLLPGVEVS
jgi:3-hydroxybutyryl-CoA dehydrogenase